MDTARLRQAWEDTVRGRGPGVFALVVEAGEVVFAGSAGTADLARPRPIGADDRFRIASVTKPYVAALVLLLAAEGRLRLTDELGALLPGLVPDADGITVEQLLRLRSGLPDYVRPVLGDPPDPARLQRWFAPQELVGIGLGRPDRRTPGGGWRYSNTDYVLLGLIAERATGRTLAELLASRVFEPLGLTATYLPGRELGLREPHVRGYLRQDEESGFVDVTEFTASTSWASGAIVSTPREVARFLDALLGGELLPRQEIARMRGFRPAHHDLAYGMGLMRYRVDGATVVDGHAGTHLGVSSYAFRAEDGRTVVMYQNCWDRVSGGVPRQSPFLTEAFGRRATAG